MLRYRRSTAATVAAGVAVVAAATWVASPVQAQVDDTAQTEAIVIVQTGITITVDEDFTITGPAGAIATTATPVEFTVTNNDGGFTVEVQQDQANLTAAAPNTDTIPFTDLQVFDIDGDDFVSLDPVDPTPVYSSVDPAPTGDTQTHDYQIDMPFVTPDTYTGTITYTATVVP